MPPSSSTSPLRWATKDGIKEVMTLSSLLSNLIYKRRYDHSLKFTARCRGERHLITASLSKSVTQPAERVAHLSHPPVAMARDLAKTK